MTEKTYVEPCKKSSILLSMREQIVGEINSDHFDSSLIIHINSIFSTLTQLGVGPSTGFKITSVEEKWSDYLIEDTLLEFIKTYMYIKLRLIFDPPQNSTVLKSWQDLALEYEWRIVSSAEAPNGSYY